MKAVKRSIAICVLTLIMCVSLLVGVTFAWFTDSITNSGNVIQAGNVDITWEYKTLGVEEAYAPVTAETPLFDEGTVWEPGLSKGYDFKVTNSGSLAADFKLTFENVMSAGMADITEVLEVSVDSNVKGTVKELSAKDAFIIESRIEADAEKEFSVEIKMLSSESQDVYQNAMVSFDLGLYAKQTNEDAVYDDNYTDPSFDAVDTVNKLIAAAPEGGVVTLPEGLELNDTLTVSQRALTINFNGAKLIGGDSSPALLVNSTASDLVIENAVIESSSETGKHGLVISAGATGVEVRKCQFTGSGNSSIFVSGSSAADPVIIEDNTFTRPINVEGQDGVIIRNNTFNVPVWSNGITMAGTMGTIEVTGNTVIGAPLVRLYNGMTVKEGSTITVTGNTFENGATAFMAAVEGATESPWSYIEAGTIVTDVFEITSAEEMAYVLKNQADGQTWIINSDIELTSPVVVTSDNITLTSAKNSTLTFTVSAGVYIQSDINKFAISNITLQGNGATGNEAMEEPFMGLGTYNKGVGIGNISIEKCTIKGFDYGIYFGAGSVGAGSKAKTVSVQATDLVVSECVIKGVYVENITKSTFTDCEFTSNGNGTVGVSANFSSFMCGVDVNLKYGDYSDIAFYGCNFNGNGYNNGGALLIKARDDGSYSSNPATLTGVTVDENCTFTNNNNKNIVIGEPNKGNKTPAEVVIANDEWITADHRENAD